MQKLRTEIAPVFKKCPNCGEEWKSREHFLSDPGLYIIGYQVNFIRLSAGYFMFNHTCKGTLTIPANHFEDLYDGPIFEQRATGKDECAGYCLRAEELRPCPAQCECAYVREIIRIIENWPKRYQIL